MIKPFTVGEILACIRSQKISPALEVKSNLGLHPSLSLHILLVDDSVELLTIMSILLRKAGVRVTVARSVDEAMSIVRNKEISVDIIVTDIEMPDADGCELARRVHALSKEEGCAIPLVALTAHHSELEIKKIDEAGFALRLQKPIKIDELTHALRKLTNINKVN